MSEYPENSNIILKIDSKDANEIEYESDSVESIERVEKIATKQKNEGINPI
jgi:hypothetical protein